MTVNRSFSERLELSAPTCSKCGKQAGQSNFDAWLDVAREKPAEVEDRAIPCHWEGDLLAGPKNSYIATLVEPHSRFAMLLEVPSKGTEAVVAALSRHVCKLPATLRRSLTWDRGL